MNTDRKHFFFFTVILLSFWFSVLLNSYCIIKIFIYYFRFLVYLSPRASIFVAVRLLLVFAWSLNPAQIPVSSVVIHNKYNASLPPLWCHPSIHNPPAFKTDLQLSNLQHVINLNINLHLFRIHVCLWCARSCNSCAPALFVVCSPWRKVSNLSWFFKQSQNAKLSVYQSICYEH